MVYHILVVDDEPDFKSLLTQKFSREIREGRYQFTFAYNGEEAYQQVIEISGIDVVLTDINMPVMDGLELLSRLNTLTASPKTIVISAYGDMSKIRTAMNNGAFDFLTKPINLQDLVITLEKTFKAVAESKANQESLKQAQAILVQSEKMSSLGQMIAGIAHEINNPINFIYGNLEPAKNYFQDIKELLRLYQKHYPNPSIEIQDYLNEIELDLLQEDLVNILSSLQVGANRIKELVLSLRNFSRLDETGRKSVDIHEGIESTLVILNSRLKATANRPKIEIIKNYGRLPKVDCYPGQINQVLMNLLANAIDALDEKNLSQSVEDTRNNPNTIEIWTCADDNTVKITIKDNGCGIDTETLPNLFDPFFTTKPVGQGTGLGLAISYQIIVERHCGQLTCESILGKRTAFQIQLPCKCPAPNGGR